MTDRMTIAGPVSVEAGGPGRVAYDLMSRIANAEERRPKDREYYLRLFAQCNLVVRVPGDIDSIVKMDQPQK